MKWKSLLAVFMAVMITGLITACSGSDGIGQSGSGTKQDGILIAYFSRYGNTKYPADIDASTSASVVQDGDKRYGTTEYIATIIQKTLGGELHRIEVEKPYPEDFGEVTDKNHEEMEENYLPPLKESKLDLSKYDTVFIGYPVWATEAPQAVLSFLQEYDLSGKTVIPFCTHDGYGAGSSYETVKNASHAGKVLDGLAVEAEDVPSAQDTVTDWLAAIGINDMGMAGQKESSGQGETKVKNTVGDKVLDGVLYDTPLAEEIKAKFPLTVSMSGYGGREYYEGIDFMPEKISGGQLNFKNGFIGV